ncbi:MAG: glycosyltransferase [bacterium]
MVILPLWALGDYVLFLNNDTEISERDWLSSLVDACEKDTRIAACQPKLCSLRNRSEFDYAGAAGGLLDIFGFPFALGRLFFSIERDEGQYDVSGEIFWACGTAMFTRKSALEEVGKFDEDFFAHVEEIDLCWRFHLAGYRVISVPKAVVYHNAGSTLTTDSYLKVMLNHRNSLVMLLKNLSWKSLIWIFPIRILLEFVAIFYSLAKVDFVRFRAVLVSLGHIILNFKKIILKRKHVHRIRRISEKQLLQKMYRRSIVFDYFIKGIQKAQELKRL